MNRSIALTATILAMIAQPAAAQFAPPSRPAARVAPRPAPRRLTAAEQQRAWVIAATRVAVSRIDFLPRAGAGAVNAQTQRQITAWAPAGSVATYAQGWTSDDCQRAIKSAETRFNIPPYLLAAIALTESGRNDKPNPFAMNIGGRTYFASSSEEMQRVVANYGGEGASIDVGCLQVNLRWHAGRFRDWRSLLNPDYNAQYAALYLTELRNRYGSWNAAVGAYHSSTPWRSSAYACIVSRRWSQIYGSDRAGCGADINVMASITSRLPRG